MLARLIFCVGTIGLLGCGGGGGDYETLREAAIAVGDTLCVRAAECGGIANDDASIDACRDGFVSDVCEQAGTMGRTCNGPIVSTNDAVDACIDALAVHSCAADDLPAECNQVL